MSELQDRHILVGISGGIAAYKTPQLVRLLRQAGAEVQVVMTRSAAQFVTATSLQAVSGQPVRDTLWDPAAEAQMGHIELARWADLIVVAPATADRLSRLAGGHADDLLGAICLASRAPQLIAPAMNSVMWEAPATQRNLELLKQDGALIIGPESGDQACGEVGPGRMTEPEALVTAIAAAARNVTGSRGAASAGVQSVELGSAKLTDAPTGALADRHVVLTAGPTREAIDPVRYISNHSSGKQGFAMARAALEAGARVTVIAGPTASEPPPGITLVSVESAREMHAASLEAARDCDLFIAVAAVADYRPAVVAEQKLKKSGADDEGLRLELVQNPDIVASIAALPDGPVVIGFAAETEKALEHARGKLARKGLDAIIVNDVSRQDIGFGSDHNAATLIWADGERALPRQDKTDLARQLIAEIAERFAGRLSPGLCAS
ncbi:MAG: bifunctional phosphopantothenoylcysteine decarboxylase/phosphopantothenate--cysteine ligase CoaBC [Pseudomonadota bacterium]